MREPVFVESENTAYHVPSIARIYREAFPSYTRSLLGQGTCETYFKAVLAHPSYRLLAALAGGEVAGFAVLHLDMIHPLGRRWLLRSLPAAIKFSITNPLYVLKRARERFASMIDYRAKVNEAAAGEPDSAGLRRTSYVDAIAVKSTVKRAGVGRALIDACRTETLSHGLDRIGLSVEGDNEAALAFYRKEGFREEHAPAGSFLRIFYLDLTKGEEPE